MSNKITVLILKSSGSEIKQISFSAFMLRAACIAVSIAMAAFCLLFYDYLNLKHSVVNNKTLETKMACQKRQIENQKHQILSFADQIDSLKDKLVELSDFGNKIRIIANINQKSDGQSVFGIGGSQPEDLSPPDPKVKNEKSLLREMHKQVGTLDLASLNQQKGFSDLLKKLQDKRNLLASTPSILPTYGWVTSGFGYRTDPISGGREFHKGVDIAAKMGSSIMATANGTISYAGPRGLFGNMVIIDHGNGMVTRYAHCSKILKKRGAKVKRGEVIARIGSTGRSTGPHLHYEVMVNGIRVNPQNYILNYRTAKNRSSRVSKPRS